MLAEVTGFPDWALGVCGALLAAGVLATIGAYAMILSRLVRIETKLDTGEGRFAAIENRIEKMSGNIRDLQRADDRRDGQKPQSYPSMRPVDDE